MKILHFVHTVSDIYGSFFYLKKQNEYLKSYGIEQYYIAYEENNFPNKNSIGENEKIYILEEDTVNDLVNKVIDPDIIHFDDVYTNYVFNETGKHKSFYEACKNRVKVRTIHDYSSIICPKYLMHGENVYCETPLNIECVKSNCIELSHYEGYTKYLQSLKSYDALFYFSSNIHKILQNMGMEESKLYKLPPFISGPKDYYSSESKTILFAGRLIPQKGIDYLLKAAARISTSDWNMIIAGTSDKHSYKEYVKLAKNLGIHDKVKFVGHLAQEELFEYLKRARIMAFPSVGHETYGFSGAEAVSYGVPVVAFSIEGIDEWHKDGITGIKVPLKDIEEYARAMESLLLDDIQYNLLRQNCIKWSKNHQLEIQIKTLIGYYKNIAKHSEKC
ncbi:MAG: glycosyltransferase family 4 protein [Bacillota bacterium]